MERWPRKSEQPYKWILALDYSMAISDTVTASRDVRAAVRIHLHPDCSLQDVSGNKAVVESPGGIFQIVSQSPCVLNIEDGWYFAEFGVKVRNLVVCFAGEGKCIDLSSCVRNIKMCLAADREVSESELED